MIRLPFTTQKPRDFSIEPLTAGDAPRLAVLHREDFLRPWSDGEFASLLGQEPVFGFSALETGRGRDGPVGFVLSRLAAGEAEILTVAVKRTHRRLGLGWKLMDAVLRELHRERAESLFLEVDELNAAAIALYRRLGFREVGKRPSYYQDESGRKSTALVMRRDLR